jgi:hypothetical protein
MIRLRTSFTCGDTPGTRVQADLETELPDSLDHQELQRRIRETFGLVRAGVENELGHGSDDPESHDRGSSPPDNGGNNGSFNSPASNKQVAFIMDLAKRRDYTTEQLIDMINDRHGVSNVYALTKKQASNVIDALGGKSRKRKAA